MKIVIAIDSFKGSLTSAQANEAVETAIANVCPEADITTIPVSDGGEGWIDAFVDAKGGKISFVHAHDPLMRKRTARFLKYGDKAIIESAEVIGLNRIDESERNPLKTSSYGLGEIMANAVLQGCTELLVGVGGTATCDCGIGMLRAIDQIMNGINEEQRESLPQNVRITVANDVTNPLYGSNGAAEVFAPQKGADRHMVKILDRRARLFAAHNARLMGYDCSMNLGAGAAGGIGYACMQFLDAKMKPGADILLNECQFHQIINDADIVITGEGRADAQTLMGKLPYRILQQAKAQNIPVMLFAGQVEDKNGLLDAGFEEVVNINQDDTPLHVAMKPDYAISQLQTAAYNIFI